MENAILRARELAGVHARPEREDMLRVKQRKGTRLSADRQASRDVFMSELKLRPPKEFVMRLAFDLGAAMCG
ncbi:MAG: hypothetical protein WBC67_18610 [Candidatus Acidiferrales bacterium]